MKFGSYILIQLAPGTARTAAEKVSSIPGVKTAHAVTGPFDVIAFAEVSSLGALSDLVLSKIQNVDGVEKTQTAVVVTLDMIDTSVQESHVSEKLSRKKSRTK